MDSDGLAEMDARKRGAQILTRTKVKAIEREEKYWKIGLIATNKTI